MNDLEVLDSWATHQLDSRSAAPAPAVRERLVQATYRGKPQPPRRRWAWRLGIAGSFAAVIALGLLGAQVVQVGDKPPASVASAAEILEKAAAYSEDMPAARPDQFIFTEAYEKVPAMRDLPARTIHRRVWRSTDGTKDGQHQTRTDGPWLSEPVRGCVEGFLNGHVGETEYHCTPNPGYRADLPGDVDGIRDYLQQHSKAGAANRDEAALAVGMDLLREGALPPAARSVLFRALAKIPGQAVTRDITDELGRPGVAVGRLVLDASTFEFLGVRDDTGSIQYTVARRAIVDRSGQLP